MLATASTAGRTVRIRGGGTSSRRGRPVATDDVLNTRGLDRIVEYTPADMTITLEGGVAAAEVVRLAAEVGQGWPQAAAVPGSTVGGVLATAASGRRRLRFGPVRDSLLEVVVATGDGRIITGGGRTVKGVTGYDVPRLLVGSLGTLGVIVQATLKLWPLPIAEGWFTARGDTSAMLARANDILASVHRPGAVIVRPGALYACITGARDDVVAPPDTEPWAEPEGPSGAGIVEVGVPPAALGGLVRRLDDEGRDFEAWMGTGVAWVVVNDAADVTVIRGMAHAAGGHAQVVDGDDAVRTDPFGPPPPGAQIMRRIRESFDPAGILAPGRFAADEDVAA